MQAFETIGITPQRLGGQVEQATATGVRMAVSNSYSQTEVYFIQHSDYLMPRVQQMRTDLAQYYQSKNPSNRLQYLTTTEERKNFQINGIDLLTRDVNVFAITKANVRKVIDELKQLALNNNTAGASIYDLGSIIKSDNIAEINQIMKTSDLKMQAQRQEQQQHEQQMAEQQQQSLVEENKMKMEFEAAENQKDREARIVEAQIKASGYGAPEDINANQQSDYLDALDRIQASTEYTSSMDMERTKETNRNQLGRDKLSIEREKIASANAKATISLQVARENKTKSELQAAGKLKEKKAKEAAAKKKKK
jgi:hypothetical protein